MLLLYFWLLIFGTTVLTAYVTRTIPSRRRTVLNSHQAFDFSSTSEWDEFYREEQVQDVIEWHSSVSLSNLVKEYIPQGAACLVTGCGNSNLPRILHDESEALLVTCLDTSSACLDQLRKQQADCPRMAFVCGDATELPKVLEENIDVAGQYQVIVDKGLTDAILCGEGWNGPLERVFEGASSVLSPGGVYLLISYRLPSSTKEFLEEIGRQVGLTWSFDLPESNDRVGVSLATKS